ncbi:MAG: hypothetical protein LUI60_06160 [Clostridia bacterium]|nr:hypothetical protein [Clostridia bacterium]
MTIHHDKLAYGRLASMKEEADEQKLKKMAEKLSQGGKAESGDKSQSDDKNK